MERGISCLHEKVHHTWFLPLCLKWLLVFENTFTEEHGTSVCIYEMLAQYSLSPAIRILFLMVVLCFVTLRSLGSGVLENLVFSVIVL